MNRKTQQQKETKKEKVMLHTIYLILYAILNKYVLRSFHKWAVNLEL